MLRALSWRYWRRHPLRLASCLLATGLAVAVVLAVSALLLSLAMGESRLARAEASAAPLQVRAVAEEGMRAAWELTLAALPGVARLEPVLLKQSVLLAEREESAVRVRGVRPGRADYRQDVQEGRMFEADEPTAAVISSALAERLELGNGALLRLATPRGIRSYSVVGRYEALTDGLGAEVLLPLDSAQSAFGSAEPLLSGFDVWLKPGANPVAVQADLQDRLGSAGQVLSAAEQRHVFAWTLSGLRLLLLILALLTVLAAGCLLLSALSLMLLEREREFGRLRAVGLSRRKLLGWLLLDLAWLIALATLLGLAGGVGLGRAVASLGPDTVLTLAPLPLVGLRFGPGPLLLAALVALALFAVSGLFLHWRLERGASRAWQLERYALRISALALVLLAAGASLPPEEHALRLGLQLPALAGLLSGLVLLIPPASAALSRRLSAWRRSPIWLWLSGELLRRYRQRNCLALASLMLSLTLLTGVFGVVHSYRLSLARWLERMYDWDLIVTQRGVSVQAGLPLSDELRWDLAVVPGVALVTGDILPVIKQGKLEASLYVFDMATFAAHRSFETVAGVSGAALPEVLRSGRNIAISRSLAQANELEVGSSLTLVTPMGEYGYEVQAVVADVGAARNSLFMDRQTYLRDWRNDNVELFTVALEAGADREEVAGLIRQQLSSRYPIEVLSGEEYRQAMVRQVRNTFGFSQVLVLVFVAMATWGLVNIGLESFAYLRHELAVLRALGARVPLLRKVLLFEVLLSAAFGLLASLTLGTLLSAVLLRGVQLSSRFTVIWYLPTSAYFVAAVTVMGLTAVLAGLVMRASYPLPEQQPLA